MKVKENEMSKKQGPRILVVDIETAPLIVELWTTGKQYVGADKIISDWHTIAWAAKWLDEDKVFYMDQRNARDVTDDKRIMKGLWKLLDEADIIISKNGKRFDEKRFNARFIQHGLGKPSSYRHIDTEKVVRKNFYFSSYSLEYLSERLCKKYKKLKHSKFPGKSLWTECIRKNNLEAWKEMETYNKYDVLSTEELYIILRPWDNSINFSVYYDTDDSVCGCGSREFRKNGHTYGSTGKFQRYECKKCNTELKHSGNELSLEKRRSMLKRVTGK